MIYFTVQDYFKHMISLGYVPSLQTDANAVALLKKINAFLGHLYATNLLPPTYTPGLTSGWRSEAYNEELRKQGRKAAKNSHHITGHAIDITGQKVIQLCTIDPALLEKFYLYAESAIDTSAYGGWSHLQDLPPASGHRIFRA